MTPACSRAGPQRLTKTPYARQRPTPPLAPVIQDHICGAHKLGGTKREQAWIARAGPY